MEKLIINGEDTLTREMLTQVCTEFEINRKTAITLVLIGVKHQDTLGLKNERFFYKGNMSVKTKVSDMQVTQIYIDKSIVPIEWKEVTEAETLQAEKEQNKQLDELKAAQ